MKKLLSKKIWRIPIIVVIITTLMMVGGGVALATSYFAVSNDITLSGTPIDGSTMFTLKWTGDGTAQTVSWYTNTAYPLSIEAECLNPSGMTCVYGLMAGWVSANEKIEYDTGSGWVDLAADAAGAKTCGFLDGSDNYFFGPVGGDHYDYNKVKNFNFRVTPLNASAISVTIKLVTGVTDLRP